MFPVVLHSNNHVRGLTLGILRLLGGVVMSIGFVFE